MLFHTKMIQNFLAPHRFGLIVAAAVIATVFSAQSVFALETRSYVVSWFWHAPYSQDTDCPGGLNPKMKDQYRKNLADLGFSVSEIATLMEAYVEGEDGGSDKENVDDLMSYRGRINGKPVNGYVHPASVVDPKLKTSVSKFAFGFDLDNKGVTPASFEDPETHELGVDHELGRILGCFDSMRGTLKEGSAMWRFLWMAMKDTQPAWTITLSGEDLDKDGPITMVIGRAMEATKYNGNGTARTNMTFRADPDPRVSKNIYPAQIKNGVISITEPKQYEYYNLSDPLLFPTFVLRNFHARFKIKADGSLVGLIGGYQPIEHLYFGMGNGNKASENTFHMDLPGFYHLLRRYADADPDPETGDNWSISATYYLELVPAYVVSPKNKEMTLVR
jgi:hypothetical protein